MSKEKKEVFVRLGAGDVVLTKEDADNLSSKYIYVDALGTDIEFYHVGYEDEDGNECDEDGNV